jgi:hypothetical protein
MLEGIFPLLLPKSDLGQKQAVVSWSFLAPLPKFPLRLMRFTHSA